MKLMMGYHDEAQKAIAQGQSWAKVRDSTTDLQAKLRQLKFEVPTDGEDVITKKVRYSTGRMKKQARTEANRNSSTRRFSKT